MRKTGGQEMLSAWIDFLRLLHFLKFYLANRIFMKRSSILFRIHMISALTLFRNPFHSVGSTAATFLFFGVLAAAAHTDRKTRTIPDKLVLAALGVSLFSIPFFPEIGLPERILGMCFASLLLLLITLCIPGAFGGGDIKLMAACGVFLGWKYSLLALGIAVFIGAAYGIWMMAMRKADKRSHIAFGPFLCMGMVISVLWGEQILSHLF